MKLPELDLKEYPDLLQEYGRAIAWINHVDTVLNLVIWAKITPAIAIRLMDSLPDESGMINKILEDMLMSKKIEILRGNLSKELLMDLNNLDERRTLLAQGVTDKEIKNLWIGQKYKTMSKKFLKETTERAKRIFKKLLKEIADRLSLQDKRSILELNEEKELAARELAARELARRIRISVVKPK